MATFEEEQTQRKKLKTSLGLLAQIHQESLVRTDVLGRDLSFEGGLQVFQRTLGLFKDLTMNRRRSPGFLGAS